MMKHDPSKAVKQPCYVASFQGEWMNINAWFILPSIKGRSPHLKLTPIAQEKGRQLGGFIADDASKHSSLSLSSQLDKFFPLLLLLVTFIFPSPSPPSLAPNVTCQMLAAVLSDRLRHSRGWRLQVKRVAGHGRSLWLLQSKIYLLTGAP